MHSLTIRKWQSWKIQKLPSPDTIDLACKTKSMSTLNNLTTTARTTLVQAQGLDKLYRPTILTPVEVTTPDIE